MGRVVLFSVTRVAQSGLADTHYILGVGKIRRDTKKFDGKQQLFLSLFKRISFETRETVLYTQHTHPVNDISTPSLITDR